MGKHKLITEFKDLMKEWDWETNNSIGLDPNTIYSSKGIKAHWICSKCGHHFASNIRTRVYKHGGCPKCRAEETIRKRRETYVEQRGSVFDTDLIKEWDYEKNDELGLDPRKLTIGSSALVWWKCSKCGNSWQAKINNRGINKRGCPYCSNHKIKKGFNDLATTDPDLIKEWDYVNNTIKPTEVSRGSGKKVYWICPVGHRYEATILHRTNGKTACPICNSGRQTSFAEQAVFFYVKKVFPDAISRYKDIFNNGMELDIYIPSTKIGTEYDGSYWHKKEKKNRERKKYELCQKYGIRLVRIKEHDSDSVYDFETASMTISSGNLENRKNLSFMIENLLIDLTKFSKRRYSLFPIEVNLNKDELAIRHYMTNLRGSSLKDLYPEISLEWCYEKNGDLTPEKVKPMSGVRVYWKCKECGHVWKTSVGHRVEGTGCPTCYRKKNRAENHYCARKIYQYSIDGKFIKEWSCISDVKRELHINDSNISMCAKHIRPKAGGYRWEYTKLDYLEPLPKKGKIYRPNLNGKAVIQMDAQGNEIHRYPSMKEAGRILGKDSSGITRVIKGELKTFAGYYWKLDKKDD